LDFGYFGKNPFSWGPNKICEELNKLGYSANLYHWDDIEVCGPGFLYKGKKLDLPKVAMVEAKIRLGYRGEIRHLFDWFELMEQNGVNFLNNIQSTQIASNKVYAAIVLSKAGISTPRTRAVSTIRELEDCLLDWKDMIIKPISGHASIRLHRMILDKKRHGDELSKVLNNLQRTEARHMLLDFLTICAQEYIINNGKDIRVHVVDNRVVSLFARNALPNTWRIMDINEGINLSKIELTPEIEKIAVDSTRALGLDYGTVDLVEGENGVTVIEVNPSLSLWQGHETAGFTIDHAGSLQYYVKAVEDRLLN
jgi:tetrahydromethanopterin:alpha-L-glutamate ligase